MRAVLGASEGRDAITLDAVHDAAGVLTFAEDGDGYAVGVPLPGRDGEVVVRVRPHGDGWRLDDGGEGARRCGPGVRDAVRRLREAGEPLAMVDDAVTSGPWVAEEAPAALLRFAMSVGFLPTLVAVADALAADAGATTGDRGTGAAELWDEDQGDWGTEDLRESARAFQEDTLRRWAS